MQIRPAGFRARRVIRTSLTAVALLASAAAIAPVTPAAAAPRRGPDLVIDTMTTDVLNPAVGETISTLVNVRNYGTGDAAPMTVTVSLPAELRANDVTDSGSGWTCATAPSGWTCSYPALPAGGRANTLALPVTVAGGTPGSTPAVTAAIAPQRREISTANNSSSVTVEIAGTCVIRGTVWQDLNGDGQRQADEPPIPGGPAGVLGISLFVRQGQALGGGQATVNADGTWSIQARTGALYWVTVEAAKPYDFTRADIGDDATDSDIITRYSTDPTLLGASAEFSSTPDATYVVDAGLITLS